MVYNGFIDWVMGCLGWSTTTRKGCKSVIVRVNDNGTTASLPIKPVTQSTFF